MAELNHDRIVQFNAENDKGTSLQIGVYMGNPSLTVFSNKAIAAKFALHRSYLTLLKRGIAQILAGKPGDKVGYSFQKYDFESKKFSNSGSLFVGRDDKALIYLGVSAPNRGPMKFLVRPTMTFDLNDPMSDVQRSELAAQTLIDQLTTDIPVAMMMTSFKRDQNFSGGGGGGGARSGGAAEENLFG